MHVLNSVHLILCATLGRCSTTTHVKRKEGFSHSFPNYGLQRISTGLQAEFDAEQEYLKTLSYLSAEDQRKYTERQGVSFMYQKPPGYDAAMSKAAEQVSSL